MTTPQMDWLDDQRRKRAVSSDDIVRRMELMDVPLGSYDEQTLCDAVAEIVRLRAEVERLRALITEWDATCEALRRPPRQWSEGDWHDAEVRLGAAVNALIEEARRG